MIHTCLRVQQRCCPFFARDVVVFLVMITVMVGKILKFHVQLISNTSKQRFYTYAPQNSTKILIHGYRFHTMATAYKFRLWICSIEDRGREKETDRKHYGGYQRSIRKKCQNIKTQVTKVIPPWRKVINYFCRDQGGTNVGCQLTTTTTMFSAVLLNMCGSSELNLLHVTFLAPGILRWILFF